MNDSSDPAARIRQLGRQFLVHSFLYYRLGEPLIDDAAFDTLAETLRRQHAAHPEAPLPFAEVLAPALGSEGSGFQIRHYPAEIISTAFKLLYASAGGDVEFTEFVERRGYQVAEQ